MYNLYSSGVEKIVEISPSEPLYYGYIFPKETENTSVIVRVESDNDICMTVSIQNTSVSFDDDLQLSTNSNILLVSS